MDNLQDSILKNDTYEYRTQEEIYILLGLIIEKENIDIEGIKKYILKKQKYRESQILYAQQRKDKFNSIDIGIQEIKKIRKPRAPNHTLTTTEIKKNYRHRTFEKWKEYYKIYNHNRKLNKIIVETTCECGTILHNSPMKQHLLTKKHKNYISTFKTINI